MNTDTLDAFTGHPLRQLYVNVVGHAPPPKASVHFLKGNIAWHLQAQATGKDPNALRQSLLQTCQSAPKLRKVRYKPGTRLIREWQGNVYEVTVHEQGFEYEGSIYRSLSQIANRITGAHCSGPRFFGLDNKT